MRESGGVLKDIRERLLQSEGDGHTTNTHGSEDRGNGDAVILQDDEDAHRVDDDIEDGVQKGRLWQFLAGMFDVQRDEAIDGAGGNARDGKHDDREEDVGEQACQRLDDVNRIDNPVEADDETQEIGTPRRALMKM